EAPLGLINAAQAPVLVALATGETKSAAVRLEAAETAVRGHVLDGRGLIEAYRAGLQDPSPAGQRAKSILALEQSADPRTARAILDNARKNGALLQVADALAALNLQNEPIEAAILSGDPARARQAASAPGLEHWRALVEIMHGRRGAIEPQLPALENLLRQNRLDGPFLHKLATVLDALDVNVPIPLWEAAGRVQQPQQAALPPPGMLQRLDEASKRKEPGRTALIALATLGGAPVETANLLALGEVIRALRRVGLEDDARALALEALLPVWPR
ncbi:MAG: hypothetical protein RL291_1154, partial [Pseudomonadota bacterium]